MRTVFKIYRVNLQVNSKVNSKVNSSKKVNSVVDGKVNSSTLGTSEPTKQVRLHALAIKRMYANKLSIEVLEGLLASLSLSCSEKELKNDVMLYFTQIDGYTARFTNSSMTLWALEKEEPRGRGVTEKLDSKAMRELREIFTKYEKVCSLKPAEDIIERHIAFTNDEYAELTHEEGNKVEIKDKLDKLARFIVDFSNGVPEAEFVHAKHGLADSKRYEQTVQEIIEDDRWNGIQEAIRFLSQHGVEQERRLDKLLSVMEKIQGI